MRSRVGVICRKHGHDSWGEWGSYTGNEGGCGHGRNAPMQAHREEGWALSIASGMGDVAT